jgi:hypothetical protein
MLPLGGVLAMSQPSIRDEIEAIEAKINAGGLGGYLKLPVFGGGEFRLMPEFD